MSAVVLFAGPTLAGGCALPDGCGRRPPAALGHVWRAVADGARTIGLIDGVFGHEPAVWHKEILFALSRGVRVLGAASMGALRAAELHPFGMEGVGWIFRAYRDGRLEDDDEVALAHAPEIAGFAPLSLPMIDLRRSLDRAVRAGVLAPETAAEVVLELKRCFYPERTRAALGAALARALGVAEAGRAMGWLEANWVEQKRRDALALVRRLVRPTPAAPPAWPFEPSRTIPWVRLVAELGGSAVEPLLANDEPERDGAMMAERIEPAPRARPEKPWRLLAFMAGDNNLGPELRYDIMEMRRDGATPRVHVACDIDMMRGVLAGRLILDEGAGTRPRPSAGGTFPLGSDPLANLDLEPVNDRNFGDPLNLAQSLVWCGRECPAKATMLVVWGHGQGLRVALDEGSRDALTLSEISAALEVTGVPRTRTLALMAFDACLMSTIENLFQLWGLVPFVLASQEVVPETGFPYTEVIRALDRAETGSAALAAELADRIIEDFARNGRPGATIAALDTGRAEAVVRALHRFGRRLAELQGQHRPALGALRLFLRMFRNGDFVDLVDLARQIPRTIADAELGALAEALEEKATAAVIRARGIRRLNPDRTIVEDTTAHGLSVWYPAQPGLYRQHRAEYRRLRCFAGIEHGWIRFLDALHGVNDVDDDDGGVV